MYPHEISGGQKQRVMIAMAIACKTRYINCRRTYNSTRCLRFKKDIIALLKALQNDTKMSIIFITHDLALISEIADRILVMYQGRIVEYGDVSKIFKTPEHNYTKALINSRPSLKTRLKVLPTIQDYLENTISETVITKEERRIKHEKLYSKPPLLEVINVEKIYISKSGWF